METEERKGRRDPEKEKFWREQVAAQAASGKNVREYCREQGLKENMFFGWRRELKFRDGEEGRKPGFVELIERGCARNSGVSIRLKDGVCIDVVPGFDEETLKTVLSAVGQAEA